MIAPKNNSIICFLPCCGSKDPNGDILTDKKGSLFLSHNISKSLTKIRYHGKFNIDKASKLTSGFRLYSGSPYQAITSKTKLEKALLDNKLKLFIISAGYGVLDAREAIHNYDEVMKGNIAKYWKDANLVNIIANIINEEKPKEVYGYFAGIRDWSNPSSKYRYFFTKAVLNAIGRNNTIIHAGCFYRKEGRGVKAILNAIGRTFNDTFENNFNSEYIKNIEVNNRIDGNVVIGFDRLK